MFLYAVLKNYDDLALALIDKIDAKTIAFQDTETYTVLHRAIITGRPNLSLRLLKKMTREQVALEKLGGWSVLYSAIGKGYTEFCLELISKMHNKNIALRSREQGLTPLMLAAKEDNKAVVLALMSVMTEEQIMLKDDVQNTVFHIFAIQGNTALILQLLSEVPDGKTVPNSNGNTPLHLAIINRHSGLALDLVNNMELKDIVLPNHFGQTPLLFAVQKNNIPLSLALIKRMTLEQITFPDSNGLTPLLEAVQSKDSQIAQAILDKLIKNGTLNDFRILAHPRCRAFSPLQPYCQVYPCVWYCNQDNPQAFKEAMALHGKIPPLPLLVQAIEDYLVRNIKITINGENCINPPTIFFF